MSIVTQGEVRVALGLTGDLSDADRAIMSMVIQKTDAKVRNVLRYNPERSVHTNRLYPVSEGRSASSSGGIWDVNEGGTRATLQTAGGGDTLQLTHLPIRQVTVLSEDRAANAGKASGAFGTTLTEGTDFYVDWEVANLGIDGATANDGISYSGLIYRIGSQWPVRARTVRVTYYAGYTADELRGLSGELDGVNIHTAAVMTAAATYKRWKAIGSSGAAGIVVAGVIESERMGEYSYKMKDSDGAGGVSDVSSMAVEMPTAAAIALAPHINLGALWG